MSKFHVRHRRQMAPLLFALAAILGCLSTFDPPSVSAADDAADAVADAGTDTGTESGKTDSVSPNRVWTDITGKHKTRARFIDFDQGSVRLKKIDGAEIEIRLKSLCAADRSHVSNQLRKRQVTANKIASAATAKRNVAFSSADSTVVKKGDVDRVDEALVVADKKRSRAERNLSAKSVNIRGINWYNSPESLALAAGSGTDNQKPIMWFRVLGDLEGLM